MDDAVLVGDGEIGGARIFSILAGTEDQLLGGERAGSE
jgi:hypothetical protein